MKKEIDRASACITVLALLAALPAPAVAQRGHPASLLIVPEYDNRPGSYSMITLTNVAEDLGDVGVVISYVSSESCHEVIREETLTDNDTFTFLTNYHNPEQGRGFAYVYAGDYQTGPIKHDYLVGACLTLDGINAYRYTTEPFAFRAVSGADDDGDGVRDLDGVEYEMAPDQLLFPRFLGQGYNSVESELILINLTGSVDFDASVCLMSWNDNSVPFSMEWTFHCWDRARLLDISLAFENDFLHTATNHDPDEILGEPDWEAGWFFAQGCFAYSSKQTIPDPAILAALVVKDTSSESAVLPFALGERNTGGLIHYGNVISFGPSAGF